MKAQGGGSGETRMYIGSSTLVAQSDRLCCTHILDVDFSVDVVSDAFKGKVSRPLEPHSLSDADLRFPTDDDPTAPNDPCRTCGRVCTGAARFVAEDKDRGRASETYVRLKPQMSWV